MFIDMLFKLIPRSIRAGIALAITFLFLPIGLQGLGRLLTGQSSGLPALWSILSLIIGASAGVTFYYFQAKAVNAHYDGMEVLHRHYKDEQDEKRLKNVEISVPKFPGEDDSSKNT